MKKTSVALALALCSAMLASAALAAEWRFMKDAPAEFFTKEDWNIFTAAYKKLLNEGKDGDTATWKNPATTASGQLTLLDTSVDQGLTCRTLKVANQAKTRKATNDFKLCKQPDGEWKIPRTSPKKAASKPASAQ